MSIVIFCHISSALNLYSALLQVLSVLSSHANLRWKSTDGVSRDEEIILPPMSIEDLFAAVSIHTVILFEASFGQRVLYSTSCLSSCYVRGPGPCGM